MDDNVGIKVIDGAFSAALAKCIRKYEDFSISEIKRIVENQEYLMTHEYVDQAGIEQLLDLNKELQALGYQTMLYEHGEETSEEFLSNWAHTMKDIAYEVELDIERELQYEDNLENIRLTIRDL